MANRTGSIPEDFPEAAKLAEGGVTTYEVLNQRTDDELLAMDGVGARSLKKIRDTAATPAPEPEAEDEDLVPVRVNRDRYYRNGETFKRNQRLRVPQYVLDDQEERKVNPPYLVKVSEDDE